MLFSDGIVMGHQTIGRTMMKFNQMCVQHPPAHNRKVVALDLNWKKSTPQHSCIGGVRISIPILKTRHSLPTNY
jgi:hypothetical protein